MLGRMESIHKIEGAAALSYLPPVPVDFPDITYKESAPVVRDPIIHLSTPFTPSSDMRFSTPSSLETKTVMREEHPFPDEFHVYLSEMFF